MESLSPIPSDEIILRRIAKNNPNAKVLVRDGVFRPTSFSIQDRPSDAPGGPSWSRLAITSPQQLLQQVCDQGLNPEEFEVCWVLVSEVEKLGLSVVSVPTEADSGHCEIQPTLEQAFSKKIWKKLSRETRVLTDDQVQELKAGDGIDG